MTTSTPDRVSAIPDRLRIDADGRPVLLGTRCTDCGTCFLGDLRFCRRCTSGAVETVELSDHGEIASYTVVMRVGPDWTGPLPYALAEVVLPERVVVASRVADWQEGDELRVGDAVHLAVEALPPGDDDDVERVLYVWRRSR
jgi:uncharacterized OB-fold protein